jgi:hypothetical protein
LPLIRNRRSLPPVEPDSAVDAPPRRGARERGSGGRGQPLVPSAGIRWPYSSLFVHPRLSVEHRGSAAKRDSTKIDRSWWLPPSPRPALRQLHPLVRPRRTLREHPTPGEPCGQEPYQPSGPAICQTCHRVMSAAARLLDVTRKSLASLLQERLSTQHPTLPQRSHAVTDQRVKRG